VIVNESELRNRLCDADAALASPQSPAPDADTCRRVLARRKRTRRAVTLTTVIAGCIAGATALFSTNRDTPPSEDQYVARLLREAEACAQKVAEHKRVVALLREAQRLVELELELAELQASLPGLLPAEVRVQEEINRVATTQLVVAGRLLDEYEDTELAADVYRHVVAEFPDTQWAARAQDAISQLAKNM
jgi:hypothetical protein